MHTVKVLSNQEVASRVHLITLSKPQGFTFVPGQFIVLQDTVEDKPTRRSYSIASAPHEGHIAVLVRSQEHGVFSPHLCSLQPDDTITLLGPFGQFVLDDLKGPVVFIGAGTGIAPCMSFARSDHSAELHVLVSARTPSEHIFTENATTISRTVTREHSEDWNEHTGRIRADMLTYPLDAQYYLCGPTAMVVAVEELLVNKGVETSRIHKEKYGKITA